MIVYVTKTNWLFKILIYLFVRGGVGLPVPLDLTEGEVWAVRQTTEESAGGLLSEGQIVVFLHAGSSSVTNIQGSDLQVIVELKSVDCEITLFCWKTYRLNNR